jgi:flagellar biosynthetic protein FlhB
MMVVAAVVAPMMLGGWLLSGKAVSPNFGKLDPLAGIARLFSTQSLAELVKALAKSLLIGGVAYLVIMDDLEHVMALLGQPESTALPHTIMLVGRSCALIAAALVLVALVDVPWQLWTYYKKLRMSREDVRQEHKESEGDPHIKAQIRRQQQAIARRRMMAEVPKADLVVTNPTHFAVALKYIDGGMRAPRVVAKGTDLVAQRIREIAADNKVAILEAPPLTRALYKHTRLGDEIPSGLYTAVAEVLAWVYQLKRWKSEGGEAPRRPTDVAVPDELQYTVPV